MLSKKIEKILNEQIVLEGYASNYYLSIASYLDGKGYPGASKFFYSHADEERMHMLKLFNYINERGGHAIVPALKAPPSTFKDLLSIFKAVLKHEQSVTKAINNIVDLTLKEKDHVTNNFIQWYVSEQLEEETLVAELLDKIDLIGDAKSGMY
ncbi:MAG: ferritin, partial [Bacteroidia bacterium]|nr:ferritin [Bacteroidia bacterium]